MGLRQDFVFKLVLIVISLAVFGVGLGGAFLLWDDQQHILLNGPLRAGDIGHIWRHAYYGFYIPLIYSVWALLWQAFDRPFVFHLFNLLLHICNVLMVYGLLKRLVKADILCALVGAMVFALHPLQVEPVAWVSGGRDLFAAFFGLAAVLVLTLRTQSWAATLLFALGLLCKPSLAVLPLAYLGFAKDRWKILALWAVLGAAALAYTLSLQAPFSDPRLEASLPERILIAADSLCFYVRNLVLPYPLNFSYDRNIEDVLSERLYILSFVYLFCAAGAVYLLARRFGRRVYAAAAFGLLFLLPVSGIVPFAGQVQSAGFDRYMYLPLFGAAVIAALVAQVKWARYTLFAFVAVYASLSFDRVQDWKNDRTLADAALEIDPANYLALNNLAVTEIAEKDYAAAENHLRAAWDSHPKEALAPANLAQALWLKNDVGGILKEIEPLTETEVFLTYNQREIEALALIHRMTARALNATLDREGAAKAYEKALAYRPDDPELRAEVGLFEKETR